MNLTELRSMAVSAYQSGFECEKHLGYDGSQAGQYSVSLCNKELTRLLDLIDEMAEALKASYYDEDGWVPVAERTLAKYKEWMK